MSNISYWNFWIHVFGLNNIALWEVVVQLSDVSLFENRLKCGFWRIASSLFTTIFEFSSFILLFIALSTYSWNQMKFLLQSSCSQSLDLSFWFVYSALKIEYKICCNSPWNAIKLQIIKKELQATEISVALMHTSQISLKSPEKTH